MANEDPDIAELDQQDISALVDALSNQRRRAVISYLSTRSATDDYPSDELSIDEVADAVVAVEQSGDGQAEESVRREVLQSLHHTHLPKLETVGILLYDAQRHTLWYHGHPLVESDGDEVEVSFKLGTEHAAG